jgi:acyl-CoA dehydrogenase
MPSASTSIRPTSNWSAWRFGIRAGCRVASRRRARLGQADAAAAKYALTYLFVQAEFGLCCPLSMTDSLTRTLRKFGDPALVDRFLPNLTTQVFDDLIRARCS